MKFEVLVHVSTQSDDISVPIRFAELKVLVLSWSHSSSSCCTSSSLPRKGLPGWASLKTNQGYVCTVDLRQRTLYIPSLTVLRTCRLAWHCLAVSSRFSQISLLNLLCYWILAVVYQKKKTWVPSVSSQLAWSTSGRPTLPRRWPPRIGWEQRLRQG